MAAEPPAAATAPALRWLAAAELVLDKIAATQAHNIETASQWCADAIAADGLVHLFGTGHSRIPVEEMFPRYGSYPGWNPIVELSMTFHTQVVGANGQRQAMHIERTSGLAEVILSNFRFGPADVMVVFSASGLTAVPVEMARGARQRGLKVIAVTSVAQSMSAEPEPPASSRLLDEADLVIDLCTPSADALSIIDNLDTPVGPGSTIAAVAIVNCNQGPRGRATHRTWGNAAGHNPRVGGGRRTVTQAVRPGIPRARETDRESDRPRRRWLTRRASLDTSYAKSEEELR